MVSQAAALALLLSSPRLAILVMVARLQPVAAWICDQDEPALSMEAMPSLRALSSGRPR